MVPEDLKYAFRAFGAEISMDELNALMKYFDTARCGRLSINEMLHAMRSNSLNEAREKCVVQVYQKLDKRGGQNVTIGDLLDNYDVTPNPEFVNGRKSAAQLR